MFRSTRFNQYAALELMAIVRSARGVGTVGTRLLSCQRAAAVASSERAIAAVSCVLDRNRSVCLPSACGAGCPLCTLVSAAYYIARNCTVRVLHYTHVRRSGKGLRVPYWHVTPSAHLMCWRKSEPACVCTIFPAGNSACSANTDALSDGV